MSSNPTLDYALATALVQVEKTFEGMPATALSDKLTPDGMTPHETLGHLTDCCHALVAATEGKEYEWGSFQSAKQDFEGRLAEFRQVRAVAAARAAVKGMANEALNYLALHEAYHVGQMCLLRLRHQPDWNLYAIYGM